MDRLYEAACEVENTIEESVAAEEFADAVRLRGVHAELQDRDEVNTVLKVRRRSRSSRHCLPTSAQAWRAISAGTLHPILAEACNSSLSGAGHSQL